MARGRHVCIFLSAFALGCTYWIKCLQAHSGQCSLATVRYDPEHSRYTGYDIYLAPGMSRLHFHCRWKHLGPLPWHIDIRLQQHCSHYWEWVSQWMSQSWSYCYRKRRPIREMRWTHTCTQDPDYYSISVNRYAMSQFPSPILIHHNYDSAMQKTTMQLTSNMYCSAVQWCTVQHLSAVKGCAST